MSDEDDEYVSTDEFNTLVKEALRVMYVRGYNEALDDILEVIKSGANIGQVIQKVKILRQVCSTSSATSQ